MENKKKRKLRINTKIAWHFFLFFSCCPTVLCHLSQTLTWLYPFCRDIFNNALLSWAPFIIVLSLMHPINSLWICFWERKGLFAGCPISVERLLTVFCCVSNLWRSEELKERWTRMSWWLMWGSWSWGCCWISHLAYWTGKPIVPLAEATMNHDSEPCKALWQTATKIAGWKDKKACHNLKQMHPRAFNAA